MKMTKRDIAGFLNIDIKTLYNWQKFKPNKKYETCDNKNNCHIL